MKNHGCRRDLGWGRAERALSAGRLTVHAARVGATHHISVSGDLDVATAPALDDELRRAQATDAHTIVVDLSQLQFIDSNGLRLLFTANTRARADHHRLSLIHGPRHVRRAVGIAGLDKLLPFSD